jgi:hypothetical protein
MTIRTELGGEEKAGATVRLRKVHELAPDEFADGNLPGASGGAGIAARTIRSHHLAADTRARSEKISILAWRKDDHAVGVSLAGSACRLACWRLVLMMVVCDCRSSGRW